MMRPEEEHNVRFPTFPMKLGAATSGWGRG